MEPEKKTLLGKAVADRETLHSNKRHSVQPPGDRLALKADKADNDGANRTMRHARAQDVDSHAVGET